MATYGKKVQSKVKKVMEEKKKGTLRSGKSGKKVTSRKQAIAIGLSEARKAGAKVPKKGCRVGRPATPAGQGPFRDGVVLIAGAAKIRPRRS